MAKIQNKKQSGVNTPDISNKDSISSEKKVIYTLKKPFFQGVYYVDTQEKAEGLGEYYEKTNKKLFNEHFTKKEL